MNNIGDSSKVSKSVSECQRSLDELKTLLSGKSTKGSEEQLNAGVEAFKDLFGDVFKGGPKRPADSYRR